MNEYVNIIMNHLLSYHHGHQKDEEGEEGKKSVLNIHYYLKKKGNRIIYN